MENKKDLLKQIKEFKAQADFDSMLALSQSALTVFPEDSKILDLLHYAQAHYVSEKLNSDIVKQLEEKGDFLTLQQIYHKLLTVFPESRKLHKLLKLVAKKIENARLLEQKEYFDIAREKILELIAAKQLDEATAACNEVLTSIPGNKEFNTLMAKIKKARDREMNELLDKVLDEDIPQLKKEYKENKKGFIHV
jgi:hypothetical protein